MKTNNRIFTAIIVMFVAAIVSIAVISCKKEKQEQALENNEQTVQVADNMDEYLISFKKRLLSAQKGDETISLEQAERDLGNLLNFDFGDANYATNVLHKDTLYAELPLEQGEVDLSRLATVYLSVFDQVRDAYHEVDLPEKSVYSISCSSNESKGESVNLVVILTIRAYDETSGYTANTGTGWRAGNRAGTCDGQLVNICGAPETLINLLRNNMGVYACANGGRLYFTDDTISFISSDLNVNPGMADPNSPSGSRLWFKRSPSGNLQNTCIPYDDLMYYYNQATHLAYTHGSLFQPAVPSDHVVTEYRYITYHQYLGGTVAYWHLDIKHAKPNCSDYEPAF